MGAVKKAYMEWQDKLASAASIAIAAGVLKKCEYHEDCLFEGSEPIESAYRLGNARFSSGELGGGFDNRREMTDAIKQVVDENCADECGRCANRRRDDS